MDRILRLVLVSAALVLAAALGGCGKKGPLYLPEPPPAVPQK
jgi:predicted small lipoprotein YifL